MPRQDPKIFFANCGHGQTRRLEDCKNLNFISAGQGRSDGVERFYFSNQIRKLIIGDILAVYRNKVGFVGIARVISRPMDISEAILGGQIVQRNTFSQHSNMFNDFDDPGYAECLVEIKWLTEVKMSSIEGSGWCYGGWTPQYVVGQLRENKLNCLENKLEINFSDLLNDSLNWIRTNEVIDRIGNIKLSEDEALSFPEGKELYKLHKSKERNKELIKIAKALYFQRDEKMKCEVCDLSFFDKYGQIGEGFIEAHHINPISELTEETETKISDLVFVCSNCHRMLHRQRPWLTKEKLRNLLR